MVAAAAVVLSSLTPRSPPVCVSCQASPDEAACLCRRRNICAADISTLSFCHGVASHTFCGESTACRRRARRQAGASLPGACSRSTSRNGARPHSYEFERV